MPWNEMLAGVTGLQELQEEQTTTTDCAAELTVELAETLARAAVILRALSADEVAK